MSKTYRKREDNHPEDWRWLREKPDEITAFKARYYTDSGQGMWGCPKWFRQMLNRHFRARCKQKMRNTDEYDSIVFPRFRKNALWEWW